MLIVVFPHPLSPGSTALPSSKGFRVEMTGTEEGRQNGLMIRRQQTGNADVFTTMILDILHSLLNVSEPRLFETLLRRIRLWQAFMERDTRPLSHEEEVGVIGGIDVSGAVNRERSCAVNGSRSMGRTAAWPTGF
ncbi:PD-(D/E)XK motif protein [Escherichia coli]